MLPCILWLLGAISLAAQLPGADDLPLRPIAGPEAPPPQTPWEGYIAIGATVGVALFALLLAVSYVRGRRRSGVPVPAHVWALAELGRIEKRSGVDADVLRTMCEATTNILRRYLSLRFDLHAPEQTTAEFRLALTEYAALPAEKRCVVLELLERADLVKFARAAISAEEAKGQLEAVRQFISDTADTRPIA
jgi:hypothetical protein